MGRFTGLPLEMIAALIFACLLNAKMDTISTYGVDAVQAPMSAERWQDWLTLEGDSIWVGYERGGWDVPDDIRPLYKLRGTQDGAPVEVWIWTDGVNVYIFPFADTTVANFAMHPCGGYVASYQQFYTLGD